MSPEGNAALKRGIVAMERGNLPGAVQEFERAVQTDPHSPISHDYLGIAYLRQQRFKAALQQFQEEIRLSSDPSTGWARVADVYYTQRNMKEAISALEQAAALRPDIAQFQYNLGMLYPQALELNKAIEALSRYSTLEPGNHYAHYLRGSLLYKLARLDDAEKSLQEAIRLNHRAGLYHFALAQVYFRRTPSPEMTERVRVELQSALEMGAPEPAAIHYYLGLCYQRKEEWEAARRALETSVKMAPEAWGAYYTLAEVLQKQGRSEEARKARALFATLRAQEDARMQQSFYRQEIERNPDSAVAHYQQAAFLMQQRDYQNASKALAQARRLAEKIRDTSLLRRVEALSKKLNLARGPK
jgi:tetratricopeptide (TPR) repeat protein